jgi:hypothetical protein
MNIGNNVIVPELANAIELKAFHLSRAEEDKCEMILPKKRLIDIEESHIFKLIEFMSPSIDCETDNVQITLKESNGAYYNFKPKYGSKISGYLSYKDDMSFQMYQYLHWLGYALSVTLLNEDLTPVTYSVKELIEKEIVKII